ncbi:hypothetical protein B5M09_013048 [Aphanomyces astaci]|uniref:Uncharacterized protein n=1 Tax=Aphanomyces astaci TaxID=112090 RepID=A0A425CQE6_APHAT|nr:hypothetical protein B5M09_013048 [Aphanomyces astaci]
MSWGPLPKSTMPWENTVCMRKKEYGEAWAPDPGVAACSASAARSPAEETVGASSSCSPEVSACPLGRAVGGGIIPYEL